MSNQETAIKAYDVYCKAVGGVAFNGDPLPAGVDFFNDATKQKQIDGWLAVAASLSKPVPATAKERLAIEIEELTDKSVKLKNFLFNTNIPDTISKEQINLLKIQMGVMETYLRILTIRQSII